MKKRSSKTIYMADEDTNITTDETVTPVEGAVAGEENDQTHLEEPEIESAEEAEKITDEAEAPSAESAVEESSATEEKAADAESNSAEALTDKEATEEAPSESEETPVEEKPVVPVVDDSPASKGRWYVVHTFSGHENRVGATLRQRIESEHLENLIFDLLVPTQDKIEIRGGKKETVKEKIFPGYILVKMLLTDESWLAVRTTQGVTSFVGAGNKPTPISEAEVNSIIKFTTQGAMPTFKEVFMVDDTIKIIDGPFADFIGKVDSVDTEKGRVRVLVSIFGRETPVELDFLQVTKL